jgi:hypothetical protein
MGHEIKDYVHKVRVKCNLFLQAQPFNSQMPVSISIHIGLLFCGPRDFEFRTSPNMAICPNWEYTSNVPDEMPRLQGTDHENFFPYPFSN